MWECKYDIGRTAMDIECNGVLLCRTVYMPLVTVENYVYDKHGNRWEVDQSSVVIYNKWNDRDCRKNFTQFMCTWEWGSY